jgi:membrane associated rhomboid family serine protease
VHHPTIGIIFYSLKGKKMSELLSNALSNKTGFKKSIQIVGVMFAILVLIQVVNMLTGGLMSKFGIYPRSITGLIGIPFAPWIHHGWWHLASNALPFCILAFFSLQNGVKQFTAVFTFITFVAGISVWLIGDAAYHAGASLMVFGLWGYLLGLAFFQRSIKNTIIAILVFVIYGGLFFSLLKFQPHISWSSHFFGMVAGVLAAKFLTKK